MTPVPRGDDWWKNRHAEKNKLAQSEKWQLVFLGDSITQSWEGAGKEVWQQHYAPRGAGNIGFSGDRTEHVLWRLDNGNLAGQSPQVVVVMIGTNNLGNVGHSPAAVVAGVTKVVEKLGQVVPEAKVLLLGVFPRGRTADDKFRAQINEVNAGIGKLADWQRVHFLDIGHVFVEADGSLSEKIMPDALHLSPEGYGKWADAIEPTLKKLLGDDDTISLFDGQSLEGWTNEQQAAPPKGWAAENGTLAVTTWGDDAFTTRQFTDFDLTVEWKIASRGNSGIFYRVADYKYIILGQEYQLTDDPTLRLRPDSNSSCGANMDLFGPAADKPLRPAGEWNQSRIVASGWHVEHWLNGQRVLSYRFDTPEWTDRLAESQYKRLTPFGKLQTGSFKLQNKLGKKIWFRDLELVEL
jgi:beta-glucosidase